MSPVYHTASASNERARAERLSSRHPNTNEHVNPARRLSNNAAIAAARSGGRSGVLSRKSHTT
jgi:hypothetical protein